MPNTKPNLKSKAGNVTHPFSEKTVNAANKIYGAEHEREMPHPLKQVGVIAANAGYNAMEAINQLKTQLDPRSGRYHGNMPQGSHGMGTGSTTVALPEADVQTFGSGSYTNPQGTTDSNANNNSSAFNYSFLEDITEGPQAKFDDPNRNKFGFWKRDDQSLQARIDDAEARGKDAKAARLKRKQQNFQDNQSARATGNFWDKINPKNWL
tara:strand:- start:3320 stop:3946 length:627 start_codon:yes stop_codon:yes gene_type:complete